VIHCALSSFMMSRTEEVETSICTSRAPDEGVFEDTASSRVNHEDIGSNRLEEEGFNEENPNYQLSSKLFSLNIDDTVEHNSSMLQNNRPIILTKPTSDSSISPKHVSEELLSIERLDRLLKMRRRRQSSHDRSLRCCREQSYNPNEGDARVISKSFPLRKGLSYTERMEYQLPEALFLPTVDDNASSDPDFVYHSKFSLKRRLKRRTVLSQQNNRSYGFIG
jgi:hypothetical protein